MNFGACKNCHIPRHLNAEGVCFVCRRDELHDLIGEPKAPDTVLETCPSCDRLIAVCRCYDVPELGYRP